MAAMAALLFTFVLLCEAVAGGNGELLVSLDMPRFASRGSSVILVCNYNVKTHEVHKVEWHKTHTKVAQYINGRIPPFKTKPIPGAHLNMSMATERSIILQDLDFEASGSYLCEVTLESPIYTLVSEIRELLVIQPQTHKPKITFSAQKYTATDTLEASCTSSLGYPAPHIIWLVNGEKVDESLTIPIVSAIHHRVKEGRNKMLASSTTKLRVAVSSLGLTAETRLKLTCLSTIPAYRGPAGRYADTADHTVIVDVRLAEEIETSTTQETIISDASSSSVCYSIHFKSFVFTYYYYCGLLVHIFRRVYNI